MVTVAGVNCEYPDPLVATMANVHAEIPTSPPEGAERQETDTHNQPPHAPAGPALISSSMSASKIHKLQVRDPYLLKTFLVLLVTGAVSFFYYDPTLLLNQHACNPAHQLEGMVKLGTDFKQELFGQHIAVDGILRSLYAHWVNPDPKKALVLCFHGSLGCGKTHTAQLIAKHLYHDVDVGSSWSWGKSLSYCSPFVRTFVGPTHFLKDRSKLKENQAKLVQIVEETVRGYGRSLFVFDEVDKMPPEVFDVLLPFMDHYPSIDGVDYRKAVFIFLSNTGGSKIKEKLLQSMKYGHKKREEVSLYDFRDIISEGAFNEQGGLFKGEMISKKLVDHYIPFLPLEQRHVIECARREIRRRNVLYISPERIAERVIYTKHEEKGVNTRYGEKKGEIFWLSNEGCKNVASHTGYFIHDSTDAFKPEL